MAKLNLRSYRVNELVFENKTEPDSKIQLEHKYSYQVAHKDGNACVGEITLTIKDKNSSDKFNIKVVILGYFTIEGDMTKEMIHVKTFKELFPYVRSFVTTMTVNAGIPPIIPPSIDIDGQPVIRVDKNPK